MVDKTTTVKELDKLNKGDNRDKGHTLNGVNKVRNPTPRRKSKTSNN